MSPQPAHLEIDQVSQLTISEINVFIFADTHSLRSRGFRL